MTQGSGHISVGPDQIVSVVTGWVLDKLHNSTWRRHDPRWFSLRQEKNIKTSQPVPGMAEQLETFLGEPEQVFPCISTQLAMKNDQVSDIIQLWAETPHCTVCTLGSRIAPCPRFFGVFLESVVSPFIEIVGWPWFSFLTYQENKPFFARFQSYLVSKQRKISEI